MYLSSIRRAEKLLSSKSLDHGDFPDSSSSRPPHPGPPSQGGSEPIYPASASLERRNQFARHDQWSYPNRTRDLGARFSVCGYEVTMYPALRNFVLFLILVVFYCIFMVISAAIMQAVERPFEQEWRERIKDLKAKLAARECINEEDVEKLIDEVQTGQMHGFSASKDMSDDLGWTFSSSLLFATSIGTTVGYGHLAPGTTQGKVLTAILTSISVPLTLLLTTCVVIRLLRHTRKVKNWMEEKYGEKWGLFTTRLVHLTIVFTCVLTFFILLSAVLFRFTEPEWNFFEGLYFSIITVSTVGLGDYVPGYSVYGFSREAYLVFCCIFLVIGVAFALLVLETLYEIPELGIHVYLLPADDESIADDQDRQNGDFSDDNKSISSQDKISQGDRNKLINPQDTLPSYGLK